MRKRTAALMTAILMVGLAGCTATDPKAVPDDVQKIMDGDDYPHARWGLVVMDIETTEILVDLNSDEFFPPGSTTKVFTVSATRDALGDDYRFTTPVYATAPVTAGTVTGDLVLVAQGDVFFGGRRVTRDELSFTNFDHMEANSFPGLASLVDEDPLAGIDDLADQIVASGVTAVTGDVIVDDRLFPEQELSGIPLHPMYINDNVIDLTLTAGAADGDAAELAWRPQISTLSVTSSVTTGDADSKPQIAIQTQPDGSIAVSGTVPEGGVPVVQVAEIDDPSSFARTALIAALRARGVSVTADPATGNSADRLPDASTYDNDARLAAHESAPFSEYGKVIEKVSHNRGADNNMCLLALRAGSQECAAGLADVRTYLDSIEVSPTGYSFGDGRGGVPSDLTTPFAAVQLLHELSKRDDFEVVKNSLAILGVNGTIATDNTGTGASGNVYAKTGTVAGADLTSGSLTVIAETLIGYIDAKSGRKLAFALYVNNLVLPEIEDLFSVFDDENKIAGLLYERY